jgi:hypothetical protein
MKKLSLLTIILMTGFVAMAQDRPQDGGKDFKAIRTPMANATRFGLAGGINMAKLSYDNAAAGTEEHVTGHTSFHIGGFVNIPLGSMFKFQPGVTFSGQGADMGVTTTSTSPTPTTFTTEYEQSLHYVNIPLVLQYQNPSGIFLELGAQPGFLVSAKKKDISPGVTNATEVDNKKDFDGFDIGGVGGIGYLTRIGLGFNVRYNFGLANIIEEGQQKNGVELKNRVLAIGLTYQFGAHK